MPDLYGRDEFVEPLRQLGHVLLWVAGRAFLPDATRSGRWVKHPREALRGLAPGASASDIVEIISPANDRKADVVALAKRMDADLVDVPALVDESSDVETPQSDVEIEDEEDEAREELEHCAAGVITDSVHLCRE